MIKSTGREVCALIEALGADHARREAAIARLIIIGPRAIARLIESYESSPDRDVQAAILRVLEATGDDRALAVAQRAVSAGGDLALAGIDVLRALLDRGSLSVQEDALDLLVIAADDQTAERRVRAAAGAAVEEVSNEIGPRVAAPRERVSATEAVWADAADGHLPDDPNTLRTAVADHAEKAPLPIVHRIIEFVRARERSLAAGEAKAAARRRHWRTVRGALHQALALRGSRIAVYDLRETLCESSEPLPHTFLAAVQAVGDESCLEPLATAFSRARADDEGWRHQLATAFHSVAKRERVTQKHSAMRRALARSPDLA
jgi:HEAT repeat protein